MHALPEARPNKASPGLLTSPGTAEASSFHGVICKAARLAAGSVATRLCCAPGRLRESPGWPPSALCGPRTWMPVNLRRLGSDKAPSFRGPKPATPVNPETALGARRVQRSGSKGPGLAPTAAGNQPSGRARVRRAAFLTPVSSFRSHSHEVCAVGPVPSAPAPRAVTVPSRSHTPFCPQRGAPRGAP